jgi:UrcA family protein
MPGPAASAASVQADPSVIAQDVSIAGLDLSSGAGRQTLKHRIALAARQVCATVTDDAPIDSDRFESCIHDAARDGWRQAEVQIAIAESRQQYASAKPASSR